MQGRRSWNKSFWGWAAPTIPELASGVRLLACISPGELHGTLFRQGIANPDARRDRTGTMRRGIAGLAERGLISPIESELLNRIVVAVISKGDVRDTHRTILELHRRITDDRKAMPVALAISGIAVDAHPCADGFALRAATKHEGPLSGPFSSI